MSSVHCLRSRLISLRWFLVWAFSVMACGARGAVAEDWGAYAIVPASAPALVLEVVGSELAEGALVSIGKPMGGAKQKWVVTPKRDDLFTISPATRLDLVLAVAGGGTAIGTRIVLERDRGEPWQMWALSKNEDGSYCVLPKHAPGKGLDHLGGEPKPGAKIDLWTNTPGDRHLHWMVRPLAGTLPAVAQGTVETGPSTYVMPEIADAAVLRGEVKRCTFAESRIFPGTVRDVAVFVPAQYDPRKPTCVYVKTDGFNAIEKSLLESLIASKEIPVTVGVFVTPGNLPAPVTGTMGRRNRCLEYDGMGDANVRFLVDELLPFVARKFDLKLSASGNDRCIAGGSSGGIAAFNAAWERPDAFSRVYANSGSFVAFRGGHEFPTLVRKFEAKPIRAYLTTGMRDMENAAGDWFLIDLEMDKALKFSGYDYQFRVINGGHVAGYYEHYREAMSMIWKGWPEPVRAGRSAPRVRDIVVDGEPWKLVLERRNEMTGPACDAHGEVFFVDSQANRIERMNLDGKVETFAADAGHAEGLSFGADGRLYSVSGKTGKIISYGPSGEGMVVAEGIRGRHLVAMPEGGLFVTTAGAEPGGSGEVWFVKNDKKTRVDSGLKLATGLAYRPDRWLLSVADGESKWVYSYQINAEGTLANKERFFWLHVADGDDDAGAESVCYTKEGPMLVATRMGVQMCADDGPTQAILPMPDRSRVVGLCFGGRELDTLFAFCGTKIWKRKVRVHGLGAFSPWTPALASPL